MIRRVLVVDDDPFICTTVSMLLALEGFEVHSAADGRAALQAAFSHAPDAILSDVNMPQMDGYALLAAVRASAALAHTRFVLLAVAPDSAPEPHLPSADNWLPKPFTREQLLRVLGASAHAGRAR